MRAAKAVCARWEYAGRAASRVMSVGSRGGRFDQEQHFACRKCEYGQPRRSARVGNMQAGQHLAQCRWGSRGGRSLGTNAYPGGALAWRYRQNSRLFGRDDRKETVRRSCRQLRHGCFLLLWRGNIACDISGISTKAPCETPAMHGRHGCKEIYDSVLHAFVRTIRALMVSARPKRPDGAGISV